MAGTDVVRPAPHLLASGDSLWRRSGRDLRVAAVVFSWISAVLLLDAGGSLARQHVLGLLTWALLVGLLSREPRLVRVQVAVVVGFASAIEYTFSPLLEVYVYRFHNVATYVPPGHGLVYLCALALGRAPVLQAWRRSLVVLTLLAGGAWALYGVTLAARPDALGMFWFCCLAGFLVLGPAPLLYVGAFAIVTYLELLGTSLGTWTWQTHDPTGWVSIGNPPSGAPGGYGWFDLAATLAAPSLLARWDALVGWARASLSRPAFAADLASLDDEPGTRMPVSAPGDVA